MDIAWNGSMWVAVGWSSDGHSVQGVSTIAWSEDGKNWNVVNDQLFDSYCYGIAWNGSMWVAVGSGGGGYRPWYFSAWSEDGKKWNKSEKIPDGTGPMGEGRGIACSDSLWVFAGNGTIAWSEDGKKWTNVQSGYGMTNVQGIAWNGSIWVAVGNTSSIAWSEDGKNWNEAAKSYPYDRMFGEGNGVAWNGSIWVAVGESSSSYGNNTIAWSEDGKTWNGLGSNILGYGMGIAWNGNIWVATGWAGIDGSSGGITVVSTDGKNWVKQASELYTPRKIASKNVLPYTDQWANCPKNTLTNTNETLLKNEYLVSSNKEYFAIMQGDGNFVTYKGSGPDDNKGAFWASSTVGEESYAIMQSDGNFVIYKGSGPSNNLGFKWGTMTQNNGVKVTLEDNGQLNVYNASNQVIWSKP